MLKEWFDSYECKSMDEEFEAKREILQHVVLAALSRSDFFEHASFYGGTALRILYGLPRYSEDIDFSLNARGEGFSLANYFSFIADECKMFGLEVALSVKDKVGPNAIESAFLKDNTEWNIITLQDKRGKMASKVKIKVEIDRNPPLKFKTEQKLILKPFSFYVTTFEKESLFAGKMHALLFREWKTRTKGRDWYDMEWYIKKGIALDLTHLQERARQSGHLDKNERMTKEKMSSLLHDRISRLDVVDAYFDVKRFVHNASDLAIWSKQYFLDLGAMIKIKS